MMDCATARQRQRHEQSHRASLPNGKRRRNSSTHGAIADPRAHDRGGQRSYHPRNDRAPASAAKTAPTQAPMPVAMAASRTGASAVTNCGLDRQQGAASTQPGQDADIDPGAQRGAQRHARPRPNAGPTQRPLSTRYWLTMRGHRGARGGHRVVPGIESRRHDPHQRHRRKSHAISHQGQRRTARRMPG